MENLPGRRILPKILLVLGIVISIFCLVGEILKEII
jgi:hypothetical protein